MQIVIAMLDIEECSAIIASLLSKERDLQKFEDDANKDLYHKVHNTRLKFRQAVVNCMHLTSKDQAHIDALLNNMDKKLFPTKEEIKAMEEGD